MFTWVEAQLCKTGRQQHQVCWPGNWLPVNTDTPAIVVVVIFSR
jgi:hypothetical protein